MSSKHNLKVCFLGGKPAAIISTLTTLSIGNKIISAVSYSEDFTNILNLLQISVFESIKDKNFIESLSKSDLLLNVHGREIVPPNLLKLPQCAINIHPYLYKYKGANPVWRAWKDANFKASVGAHIMTDRVDEGKVLIEEFIDVSGTTSVEEIYNRLYPYYCIVILKVLDMIGDGHYRLDKV